MVPNDKIKGFIESMAHRDRRRPVSEAEVRSAIQGYARCIGIANRVKTELTQAQLERAVRYYRARRNRSVPQLELLTA